MPNLFSFEMPVVDKSWLPFLKWGSCAAAAFCFYQINTVRLRAICQDPRSQGGEKDIHVVRFFIYESVGLLVGLRIFYVMTCDSLK